MPESRIGQPAPDIALEATGGQTIRLPDLQGRWLVLFFYPRASTPGCTQEGRDFAAAHAEFLGRGAVVVGASRDKVRAQENFKAKQGFPYDLLADPDEQLCNWFDLMREKTMYGKRVRGIERSTFLIDPAGVVRREWRKVKIEGHVAAVLAALDGLLAASS